MLGSSQLVGLLETPDRTYAVFYVDETTKLKARMEISAAERFMMLNNTNPLFAVVFMNEDLKRIDSWASGNGEEYRIFCQHAERTLFKEIGDANANA